VGNGLVFIAAPVNTTSAASAVAGAANTADARKAAASSGIRLVIFALLSRTADVAICQERAGPGSAEPPHGGDGKVIIG
jgi:hypothetical protein